MAPSGLELEGGAETATRVGEEYRSRPGMVRTCARSCSCNAVMSRRSESAR